MNNQGFLIFFMCLMMCVVMLILQVVLMFFNLGVELIFSISGLCVEWIRFMLYIDRFSVLVECIVICCFVWLVLVVMVVLLVCRLEWKLFFGVCCCIDVIIWLLIMKQCRLVFLVLLMNFCIRKLVYRLCRVLMMLCEVLVFLVRIMLCFWVFLLSFIIWGGGLSMDSRLMVLLGLLLNMVIGMLMFLVVSSWCVCSLLCECRMVLDGLGVCVFISLNWCSMVVLQWVMEVLMCGMIMFMLVIGWFLQCMEKLLVVMCMQ